MTETEYVSLRQGGLFYEISELIKRQFMCVVIIVFIISYGSHEIKNVIMPFTLGIVHVTTH